MGICILFASKTPEQAPLFLSLGSVVLPLPTDRTQQVILKTLPTDKT